jgi:hypothetical protein
MFDPRDFGSRACAACLVWRSRGLGMVDCKVPDDLGLSVSKHLEVLGMKVSYGVVLRVPNDHAHLNQVDVDLEGRRVIRRVLCGWSVTGRR